MKKMIWCVLVLTAALSAQPARWTGKAANAWYAGERWPVGSNYLPASAINELEMWQARTFDPKQIDKELGWAQDLGMNTMRVFLHDLPWQQDAAGYRARIDRFLAIAGQLCSGSKSLTCSAGSSPWPTAGWATTSWPSQACPC